MERRLRRQEGGTLGRSNNSGFFTHIAHRLENVCTANGLPGDTGEGTWFLSQEERKKRTRSKAGHGGARL